MQQRTLERPRVEPRTADRPAGTEVRYVCVNPTHQGRRASDTGGVTVVHSGTFGFCPCRDASGPHAWRPRRT